MRHQYTTLVVEDEKLIRENIILKITQCDPDFHISGSASDGEQALKLIKELKPDVVITDIKMPVIDGLELIKRIKTEYPHILIVIISGHADFSYAQAALRLDIEDYILKPIKFESLKNTLNNIRNKLDVYKYEQILNTWLRAITLNEYNNIPQNIMQNQNIIALINLGNLCSNFFSTEIKHFYENLWGKINLNLLSSDTIDIFVLDEHVPNSKLIIFSDSYKINPQSLIKDAFSQIKNRLSDIKINIVFGLLPNPNNISKIIEKLRIIMSQQLVIGKDKVLDLNESLPVLPAVILNNVVRSKVIHLINYDQLEMLKKLFLSEINDAFFNGVPQNWIKDYIHQMLRLIQQYSNKVTEAELQHIEYTLFDSMSYPLSQEMLIRKIDETLSIVLQNSSEELDEEDNWISEVKSFLLSNYCSDISLDDISKKFNYTASHLIKIFKRQTGETPMKYIINLRISTAKTLLKDEPLMDIKQISESVGYFDQHYFSRIFKSITGLSPSDYRQKNSKA